MRTSAALLGGTLLLAACELVTTDTAVEKFPAAIATPSFSRDIAPLLAESCASSGACHFGPSAQQGLELSVDSSYANLVNQMAQCCAATLVTPGDSAGSFLPRVMSTDITVRGGYPWRMPLTEIPMPQPVVQTIKNWIAQGAQDN